MCFPAPAARVPAAPLPPARTSAAVDQRVQEILRPQKEPMPTVLTSPLGDPTFGKNINRTVLTGTLT